MVSIANTVPRPFSIPYISKLVEGESFSVTSWIQFAPGVSIDLPDEIWEQIKNHPDIKSLMEEKSLIPINLSIGKTENLGGIEALIDGNLVSVLEQPVPITHSQTKTIKSDITVPDVGQLDQELETRENLLLTQAESKKEIIKQK